MNIEKEILSSLTKLSKKKVTKTDNIADLNIDSLDLVELVVDIEGRLNISISDDELKDMVTIKDIIDCFQSKVK